jgi:hypothetical protein
VGREEHGDAALAVHGSQELAHPRLCHDVEPHRGLVEEEDLRVVQHRRGQLAAHALAEGKLPHRGLQEGAEVEQVGEGVEVARQRSCGTRYM